MSKKLQNIKAIKQLLAGEHRTQTRKTFYYGDAEDKGKKTKIRNVGDRWVEEFKNGTKIYWEQMKGYRRSSSTSWKRRDMFQKLQEELKSFSSCPKEICTCKNPNNLDEKFRRKMGMCFDCVLKMELDMQIDGKFDKYADEKMFKNVKAYINDMDIEMTRWKEDVRGKMSFANGDETIEDWESNNSEALIKRMETEYNEMRKMLLENYDPNR